MATLKLSAEEKQQLMRIYSDVTKSVYDIGVIELKVETCQNMILFIAKHHRVPILTILQEVNMQLKQSVDVTIHTEFKERLKKQLIEEMGLDVKGILKDFDSGCKQAVTTIIL